MEQEPVQPDHVHLAQLGTCHLPPIPIVIVHRERPGETRRMERIVIIKAHFLEAFQRFGGALDELVVFLFLPFGDALVEVPRLMDVEASSIPLECASPGRGIGHSCSALATVCQ